MEEEKEKGTGCVNIRYTQREDTRIYTKQLELLSM